MHYSLSTMHSLSPAFAVLTDAVNKLMTSFISARSDFDYYRYYKIKIPRPKSIVTK